MKVEIIYERPPIWEVIIKKFPTAAIIHSVFAMGDKIYVPSGIPLIEDLRVHELVHCERQKFNEKDAKDWWANYLTDPKFRLVEEGLAYQAQGKWIKEHYDYKKAEKMFYRLAKDLSGKLYNEIMPFNEAYSIISGVKQ